MNVLLVGMSNRNFLPDLQHNLRKQNITADLIDLLEGYFIDSTANKTIFGRKIETKNFLKKNLQLYYNFRKAFQLISHNNRHYQVCNIHFLDVRYYFFKRKLCKLADKLVVSTYGSDFYKYSKYSFLQKPFYKKASRITFSNPVTQKKFNEFYNNCYAQKLFICRFGLSILEEMRKQIVDDYSKIKARQQFDFPENKTIITVGYHSNPITQQIHILTELFKIKIELKSKIFLVFPMAYGGFTDHINKVENIMKDSEIPYSIIRNYLSTKDIIKLRLSSDIMINLPVSDQLSATMCEYLYTGNWVITGRWLPYESIDQTGVNYDRIDSFDQLTHRLNEILPNLADIKRLAEQNPDRIWNFSSWEQNINAWLDVYSA
jgi:glycosyltransferase involved in cell wall biosynthesis